MKSLEPAFLDGLRFTAEESAVLRQLGEYQGRQELFEQQKPEVLESLKSNAIIESSESSNRLEGITAPKLRVEGIVEKRVEPRNRSEQEIAGYRDGLNLIHESGKDMPITVPVIKQLHQYLYRYLPSPGGEFKMTDNKIVEKDARGNVIRVRFTPVSTVATPGAMDRLASLYAASHTEHRVDGLILVPLVVLDFLCIHPFTDGNGRVGRLLTLLLLYHFGHQVGRFISLERIIEESKASYYETLETSSQGWHEGEHDVHPWLKYFWGVLIRAYKEFEDRVGSIEYRRGGKSDWVRERIRQKVMPFKTADIERECPGVSRATIREVLRELRNAGEVVREGVGRGVKWRPTGKLAA